VWGGVSASTAFVQNEWQFYVIRFLLGASEAHHLLEALLLQPSAVAAQVHQLAAEDMEAEVSVPTGEMAGNAGVLVEVEQHRSGRGADLTGERHEGQPVGAADIGGVDHRHRRALEHRASGLEDEGASGVGGDAVPRIR